MASSATSVFSPNPFLNSPAAQAVLAQSQSIETQVAAAIGQGTVNAALAADSQVASKTSQSLYNSTLAALQACAAEVAKLNFQEQSPFTDPAQYTQWWNAGNESLIGQVGSAVGSAVGAIPDAVGQALGGSVGGALQSAGTWTSQAITLAANQPAQAAADAAQAAPGLLTTYALGTVEAVAAGAGDIAAGIGQATGNQGLEQAGNQLAGDVGQFINTGVSSFTKGLDDLGAVANLAFGNTSGLNSLLNDFSSASAPPASSSPTPAAAAAASRKRAATLGIAGAGIGASLLLLAALL